MMTRERMIEALELLNGELAQPGVTGEICVVGGAAMVLAFRSRDSTRDIDALMWSPREVRQAAARVAEKHSLPPDWLNDGVKGFSADKGEIETHEILKLSHLRVIRPEPEYILAMKCVAARVGLDEHDKEDAVFLIRLLGLRGEQEILGVVRAYYREERIPAKTRYFIGEICHELFPESG